MKTQRYSAHGVGAAGGAGLESYVELWNPAANQVTLLVRSLKVNTKDTSVKLKYHTSQQGAGGTVGLVGNKHLGGVASNGSIYGHSLATVAGTQVGLLTTTADTDLALDLGNAPFVIDPGKSFIIENVVANLAINLVNIEYDEIEGVYA